MQVVHGVVVELCGLRPPAGSRTQPDAERPQDQVFLASFALAAGAAGTGQGHQPVIGEQPAYIVHLGFAPNETGELYQKIVRTNAFSGTQWREIIAKIGVAQLHHPFRAGQIAQRVSSQVGQPGAGRETIDHHDLGRTGQHRLPTVGQAARCG